MSKVRTPCVWVGGKSRLVDWLLPHLNVPCRTYCEPLGGSAAVLLNRRRVPVEVYNDVDGALVTLMLCVKHHPEELRRCIEGTPYSREHYEAELTWLKAGCPGRMTDLQFTARWWWLNLASFGGIMGGGFGVGATELTAPRVNSKMQAATVAADRLRNVLIEHEDFAVILNRYDTPETLFYCDPPYVDAEDVYTGGGSGFAKADHRELAERLNNAQGKVALSYYPCDLVDELYPADRWRRVEKKWVKSCAGVTGDKRGTDYKRPESTELLLMNYPPPAEQAGLKF